MTPAGARPPAAARRRRRRRPARIALCCLHDEVLKARSCRDVRITRSALADRCCGLDGESVPWPSWPPPSLLQAPAGRAASNTTLTTSRRSTSTSLLHHRQRAAPFALAGRIARLAPSAPHRSAQPRVSATSSQTARKGMPSGTTMSQLVFLGRVVLHHRHRQGLDRHRHCRQPRSRPQFL